MAAAAAAAMEKRESIAMPMALVMLKSMEAKVKRASDELAAARAQLKHADTTIRGNDTLIARQSREISELEHVVSAHARDLARAKHDYAQAIEERKEALKQVEALRTAPCSECPGLQNSLAASQNRLKTLESENSELRTKASTFTAQHTLLAQRFAIERQKLRNEHATLTSKLEQALESQEQQQQQQQQQQQEQPLWQAQQHQQQERAGEFEVANDHDSRAETDGSRSRETGGSAHNTSFDRMLQRSLSEMPSVVGDHAHARDFGRGPHPAPASSPHTQSGTHDHSHSRHTRTTRLANLPHHHLHRAASAASGKAQRPLFIETRDPSMASVLDDSSIPTPHSIHTHTHTRQSSYSHGMGTTARATCNSTPEPATRKTPDNKNGGPQIAPQTRGFNTPNTISAVLSAFSDEIYTTQPTTQNTQNTATLRRAKTARLTSSHIRRVSQLSNQISGSSSAHMQTTKVQEGDASRSKDVPAATDPSNGENTQDPVATAHSDSENENEGGKFRQSNSKGNRASNKDDNCFAISRRVVYGGAFAALTLALGAATFFTVRAYQKSASASARQRSKAKRAN